MTYQPDDISFDTYDENRFRSINTKLSLPNDPQNTSSKFDIDPGKDPSSPSGELSAINITNEFIDENADSCATPTLAPSYNSNEQSFLECEFDESQLLDPFEDPINEVTVTTTISDVEISNKNDTVNNTPSELNLDETPSALNLDEVENLTPNVIENIFKAFDQFSLQSIDNSIQERTMSVETQPPVNLRPRYKSDGIRQIEKSRTKPMVIKLPNIKDVPLDGNQSFLLRLSLITCSNKSSDQVNLHVNTLEYHSDGVQTLNDGSVCVPVNPDEAKKGKKVLSRSEIVKTKLEAYKSELTPYSLLGNDESHQNTNENESQKMSAKQAKNIFKKYNMGVSRIACQLLIKQNDSLHYTNIVCETEIIKEKEQKNSKNKRSAKEMNSDDEDERSSSSKSKTTKRKKRSKN